MSRKSRAWHWARVVGALSSRVFEGVRDFGAGPSRENWREAVQFPKCLRDASQELPAAWSPVGVMSDHRGRW